jgi:hypothetical protein
MGQSASKIAEAEAKSEAQVKPRQASLQSKTTVDASPLGQPGGAITSRPKDAIDAERIDDLNLEAPHRKLPSSSVLSPIAHPTSSPPMAPGVGGFNIDPPVPRLNLVQIEVAIAHMRRQALSNPNLVLEAPIQAQRMAVIVETGESSSLLKLLVILATASAILFVLREETQKQLSGILEAVTLSYEVVTPSSKVSSAETSTPQARLVVESQKGFANEPLPLGIWLKNASGVETVTVAGLAQDTELSLGTYQGPAGWLLSARDLDKTFVGTRQDFVGVMDTTVTLRSSRGELLDSQVVRFEWVQKK